MESIALIIYPKTLGFQQNLCHSETTYNSKHVFKWHFARDQSNSLHLVLWIVYIYMTNGVKRPKAIIKDPKACQADGGSFVYRIRNGQIVDVGQSLLEQTVLFSCHIPFILFTRMLDGK